MFRSNLAKGKVPTKNGCLPRAKYMQKMAIKKWWKPVLDSTVLAPDVILRREVYEKLHSFIKMAYLDSHKVGCAVKMCDSDYLVKCIYREVPHQPDVPLYMPGEVCSDCKAEYNEVCEVEEGLCEVLDNKSA
ncbi:unnamed protein product [Strongylus vulgaris]|uniref:SCP domain-containing protein n=1 Tax=Strongylus vulgaris TaxID=40348 RepID=A0A3P7JBN2_STRVU|nr:unnamed protein product [Strongylus vulgaris]